MVDRTKMDENWRNHISLIEKRIENLIKVMKDAKDYDTFESHMEQ